MTTKRWKRHSPEQIIAKLRDADAMPNAGKDFAIVLQALEVSESTCERWRGQYGGMKAQEAKRLKELEDENRRLKRLLVADQALDIQMLKSISTRETGEPFSEACGGRRTAAGVHRLRTKAMQGNGSAAQQSALRAKAALRRAGVGQADAGSGPSAAAIWLSACGPVVAAEGWHAGLGRMFGCGVARA